MHDKITMRVALPLNIIVTIFFGFESLLGGICGSLMALIMNPDLDLSGVTRAEGNAYRLFVPFGILWQMFWTPYGRIKHRSFISHGFIIGTFGRVLYLALPLSLLGNIDGWSWQWLLNYQEFITWFIYGLLIADTLHLIADGWKI